MATKKSTKQLKKGKKVQSVKPLIRAGGNIFPGGGLNK